MKTETNPKVPSEAELFIIHSNTNHLRRVEDRETVREAVEALNRSGRDAYAAMVASISENERKKAEATTAD